ncbi:helicase-exonuclease AddAB subunit AddA [Brevibacillus sp. SYSU BS000544]|uniref:helicase-exonuclease AddAB subunit AddA n=1 Tax=Brevibacillus sp. SYSU BS000544 TaxID=3416443 RepID=UPI003CE55A4F
MTTQPTNPGQWTDEQWEAIITKDQDILVAAAAGSGKTSVLVERIIRRVLDVDDPVGVDELLVVTFTNAAAAEMRHRIGDALRKAIEDQPESVHLRKQLTLLQRATITTLHSFCLQLLRQYYYVVDLDPSFRIGDQLEMELIRQDVLESQLEEWYSGDGDFLVLADALIEGQDDSVLSQLLIKLYEFSRSHPEPNRWLADAAGMFDVEEDSSVDELPWMASVLGAIRIQLQGLVSQLHKAIALAASVEGPNAYVPLLEKEQLEIQSACTSCDSGWEAVQRAIQSISFGRLPGVKEADPLLKEQVQALRNGVKDRIKKIGEEYFVMDASRYVADIRDLAPRMRTMTRLIREFDEAYQREKRSRDLVDFGDLEHFALQILTDKGESDGSVPSAIARQLREQFAEVLVDEYQDINLVQETILRMVSRDAATDRRGNRFMVGDVKQSIYRFRLAEPKLFMEKYLTFSRNGSIAKSGYRIDLAANFRSRKEVVDSVNFIFRQVMTPRVGEIEYDRAAELIGRARYPEIEPEQLTPEVHLIDRSKPAEEGSDGLYEDGEAGETAEAQLAEDFQALQEEATVAQLEARLIAKRIRKWMEPGEGGKPLLVYDKKEGGMRPLAYRDIVILLRATAGWAQPIMEEFRAMSIPVYTEQSDGYFGATEIEVMMSLLRVIDNPRQDIPLASVLRSPIVGLLEEQLAHIRVAYPGCPFYQAVESCLTEQEGPDSDWMSRLRDFYEVLEQWRTKARQGSLADLIAMIYRDTGYRDYVASLENGVQRQANLQALYDRARQYESTSYRGLFRFLRFIDRLKERGSDLGEARVVGENEDVVRIMTIHKSKGLEFPVVFVAGLGKQFNTMDMKSGFLLHKDFGFGPQVVDTRLGLRYPSASYLGIKLQLHREMLAEEMRVLYVALTRAREKLILVGSLKDATKSVITWCQQTDQSTTLADEDLINAKGYLDWVGRSLVRHPDGAPLRQIVQELGQDVQLPLTTDPSRWQIILHHATDFPSSVVSKGTDELTWRKLANLEPVETRPRDDHWRARIEERLSWKYPYPQATQLAAKWTVTELKRLEDEQRKSENSGSMDWASPNHKVRVTQLTHKPKFLMKQDEIVYNSTNVQKINRFSKAEIGSIMHLVMQHIDLRGNLDRGDIERQLERLIEHEFLTKEQADQVSIDKIVRLFESELGVMLKSASRVHRELPFTMAVNAREVLSEQAHLEGDMVILQGVLDCLIEHPDGSLTLVDYKTDAIDTEVTPGLVRNLEERYRKQVQSYVRAVESMWKREVKDSYLYFFSGDLSVQVKK